MEKRTKIFIGVGVVIVSVLIGIGIYLATSNNDTQKSENDMKFQISGDMIGNLNCPTGTVSLNSEDSLVSVDCGKNEPLLMKCDGDVYVDYSDQKKNNNVKIYCKKVDNPECKPGQTDVSRFDCTGSVLVTKNPNYAVKCNGEVISAGNPALDKDKCSGLTVSCVNGKCTMCCDTSVGATGVCPPGTTLLYSGKCNDAMLPGCDESGCSYICNGKKIKVPDQNVKSITKSCINGQCVLCGSYQEDVLPTCLYGQKKWEGKADRIIGGCTSSKCALATESERATLRDCKKDANFSCINGNCVACC